MYSPIKQKLLQRGYRYQKIQLANELYHQYIAPNGARWIYSWHFRNYPFISISARKISINKLESYAFARMYDVPTPDTIQTDNPEDAMRFLEKHSSVIVKPLNMGGGTGVTVDIVLGDQLRTAIALATFDDQLPMIQEQFFGEEIRLTVIKGKVRSVILRQTPRVVGDGKHTVSELIQIENKERALLQFPLVSCPQLDESNIPAKYLDDTRVLEKDEILELSKSTMIKHGASFYGVLNEVHANYIAIAERLALALNPAMLVIDLMVTDHTLPAAPDNHMFLEFNTAPAPAIYSSLRGGDSPDIVEDIVSMIDEYCRTYSTPDQ